MASRRYCLPSCRIGRTRLGLGVDAGGPGRAPPRRRASRPPTARRPPACIRRRGRSDRRAPSARAAHRPRGAVEIAGDDVPADAPAGQMIQRRHPAREQIRRLIGEVAGHAEAEMRGGMRHRGHQRHRIQQRDLHAGAQRRVRGALQHVVNAQNVGEEQAVEQPALQRAGQRHPMIERGIVRRSVARVRPHAVLDVTDTGHIEGVEADLLSRGAIWPW